MNFFLWLLFFACAGNEESVSEDLGLYLMLRSVDRFFLQHGRFPGGFCHVQINAGFSLKGAFSDACVKKFKRSSSQK